MITLAKRPMAIPEPCTTARKVYSELEYAAAMKQQALAEGHRPMHRYMMQQPPAKDTDENCIAALKSGCTTVKQVSVFMQLSLITAQERLWKLRRNGIAVSTKNKEWSLL